MEKYALDERTHCLFRLDRWDEILNLGEKMRDMQQRYPREQIGASCQTIAMDRQHSCAARRLLTWRSSSAKKPSHHDCSLRIFRTLGANGALLTESSR